ncbi:hypothetical protein PA25_16850 [Pseudoalteromonas sp. A25]|nr:hypothetical protein PA25_16850 [Pseudoalteromonas sp. A25]
MFAVEIDYINLSKLTHERQNKVKNWVEHGVRSTFVTLGPLNQKRLPVTLKPRYFAFEPVPWASVKRGQNDGIELHFHRYASTQSLLKDWSLYHELAHLYHPLFSYDNFWLSEGLATYLQNIIMLNNGVVDHQEFLMRLKAGLQRGALQTNHITGPLNIVSDNMWSLNAQQRVYWSGTAFFIQAQLALKKHNSPYKTIEALVKKYQSCCKHPTHSAKQFIAHLDKLSQSAIFSTLYSQYIKRTDFPKISNLQLSQLRF